MQSKIKSITHKGTWEGKFGTMHKQLVCFEDGMEIQVNSKEQTPPYGIGDLMEYHVSGEYQGTKNGKINKPEDEQQGSRPTPRSSNPDTQKQIVRQSCLKCACEVLDSKTEPIQIVGLAQYFFDWCISGEVKPAVGKAPAHIEPLTDDDTDDLPF